MTGIEVVVGFLAAWAVRKARRVGDQADAEVDRVLDTAMDRLHETVSRRLEGDPALRRLELEASEGIDNPRTRQRVELALDEAAEQDTQFADTISVLAEEISQRLRTPPMPGGHTASGNTNSTVVQAGRDVSGNWMK